MYPALLPLMRTPRLPVVDRTEAIADLDGPVRFAERGNVVSARVASHFKRSLQSRQYLKPAAGVIGHIRSAICGLKGTRLFGIKYCQGRNFS